MPDRYEPLRDYGARVIEVIEVAVQRGQGVVDNPTRRVHQYRTLDGELLAENDPFPEPAQSEEG